LPDDHAVATYLRAHEQALAGLGAYAAVLEESVQHGEAFLFLDSLDEVDPGYRAKVLTWIREQQERLNLRGALVVSTRFTDYVRSDFITSPTAEVRPFAVFTPHAPAGDTAHYAVGVRRSIMASASPSLRVIVARRSPASTVFSSA
jgi:hypothetical protein